MLFSLAMGTGAGVGLYLFGALGIFPEGKTYALAFATWFGFMELIPYVGPILGAMPPVLVAFFGDPLTGLWVALLFVALQQVEGHIVAPTIFGHTLRINPLFVIFALLLGGEVYGIVGALVALPILAVMRETVAYLAEHLELEPWGAQRAGRAADRARRPAHAEPCPECDARPPRATPSAGAAARWSDRSGGGVEGLRSAPAPDPPGGRPTAIRPSARRPRRARRAAPWPTASTPGRGSPCATRPSTPPPASSSSSTSTRRLGRSGSAYPFSVLDAGDGDRLIGRVALANVVRGAWQNATLGYWIAAPRGGRGHATRAVALALSSPSSTPTCTACSPLSSRATPPRSGSWSATASAMRAAPSATCRSTASGRTTTSSR